jgi:hypothetical protein
MSTNRLHNELYKLAIRMNRVNGKGVKHNLDLLLNQIPIRNNERNNSVQLKFNDMLKEN